ncbi:hypothetical protein DMB92_06515 [Campylobacter sp. MIT 99-7217]|uniref:MBL fold metallo-hydrolase n=1 Tax=Campylobacter sp. MIT 99-7217 TaxID=535091 RepID=UPI0011588432|nr:MBL fold metallo-hydrolase [Campylobacter sp. MIT 99-7217]TQR31338.1 hypothetical protein DMB92_06515 [Campylobacter sp. MIT 99-7217]
MKKIILLIFAFLLSSSFVKANDYFEYTIQGVEVKIFSLGKRDAPVDKLIFKDKSKAHSQALMKNEHNLMLIKDKNFIMLVDTGFTHTRELLKESLARFGVKFEDITHLVITHAHADHIGGILNDKGGNNFPNASLLIDEKEYTFWTNSNNELSKNALLIFKDKKQFFDHSKPLVNSKLHIKPIKAYGHTPGHNVISLDHDKFVFIADLVHVASIQFKNPDIAIAYDLDKDQAIKTRKEFLKDFEKNKSLILGVHTPYIEFKSLKDF